MGSVLLGSYLKNHYIPRECLRPNYPLSVDRWRDSLQQIIPGVGRSCASPKLGLQVLRTVGAVPMNSDCAAVTTSGASQSAHYLYNNIDDHTMCTLCMSLGAVFTILTVATTGRFLLSFYPGLERAARQARGPILLRSFVLLDALLDPTQRHVFKLKEQGDVNYASVAVLAAMSCLLEVLFGDSGLLARSVPDLELLRSLRYLIFFQQTILIPQWTMAVFRSFFLI